MIENVKLLETILNIQSYYPDEKEMQNFIIDCITIENVEVYQDESVITATKNTNNLEYLPTFCCHVDTVHKIVKNYKVTKEEHLDDIIYSSKTGIGGDDKNGIFICLELLKCLDNVKIVFFSGEEQGCIGASNVSLDLFDNCSYMIELDRKGNDDIIATYFHSDTVSDAFWKDLKPIANIHQYSKNEGVFTDVMQLAERGLGISVINLSCGYYNAHSKDEYISVRDIRDCIDFCIDIADSMQSNKKYTYEFSTWGYDTGDYYYHVESENDYNEICEYCFEHTYSQLLQTKIGGICIDCATTIINECIGDKDHEYLDF